MKDTLLIGFKGKNNLSGELVKALGQNYCLLTNSFGGLKKDIDSIDTGYDRVMLFGVDKTLMDMCVRVPEDKDSMLAVSGVGKARYEQYGEQFLEAIQEFKEAHPGEVISTFVPGTDPASSKSSREIFTLRALLKSAFVRVIV